MPGERPVFLIEYVPLILQQMGEEASQKDVNIFVEVENRLNI